ncbi:hypothetical protein L1987_13348 [Smallanthus sonchifolius]|uniref:Uncharacterized protein n=1 Tax=Smallanthus sonchifolius TaxID=185202 RepID=A0ACB9JHU2_9ASTR|nr:hypothetical protein L1987_13348 [Smallanthus sonchifolius]
MVLLKVSPWKGIIQFRKPGKLSPRFVGPFKILARVSQVAYRLDLPVELSGIHPTFHVSHLRKCLADDRAHIPYNEIEVDNSLNYVEELIAIIDRAEKRLRNKSIHLVKVQWKHRKGSEVTWEKEDEMRGLYPQLFNREKGELGPRERKLTDRPGIEGARYCLAREQNLRIRITIKVLHTYQVRKKDVLRTYHVRMRKIMRTYQVRRRKNMRAYQVRKKNVLRTCQVRMNQAVRTC